MMMIKELSEFSERALHLRGVDEIGQFGSRRRQQDFDARCVAADYAVHEFVVQVIYFFGQIDDGALGLDVEQYVYTAKLQIGI